MQINRDSLIKDLKLHIETEAFLMPLTLVDLLNIVHLSDAQLIKKAKECGIDINKHLVK